MANKVIKLISLENIFSHKLKSYIYIHLGQKFLLTSARINSNLILVARNNYTIIFVERTKKKKKKIPPNELEQTFRCTKLHGLLFHQKRKSNCAPRHPVDGMKPEGKAFDRVPRMKTNGPRLRFGTRSPTFPWILAESRL